MQNFFSSEKKTGSLRSSSVLLLLSPGEACHIVPCSALLVNMTFLKMSVCGDSRCTNTSLNSIFMNLSQVLHSTFLDNCFKQQTSLSPFQELIKILPMYLKDSQYILVQRSANSLFSYDLTTFVEGLDDRLLDNFPITVVVCSELNQDTCCIYTVCAEIHLNSK